MTETVVVTAEATPLISPDRMGSGTSVVREADQGPADRPPADPGLRPDQPVRRVDRQRPDAARSITVAGKNNRYNTIQIDGAVNNDLFGLADTGTPGGQADTQPITLDAVQELQLVVSPYDIKQGGFTGGGINAITRSGLERVPRLGLRLDARRGLRRRQARAATRSRGRSPTFNEDQYGARARRADPQGQALLLRSAAR